MDKRVIVILIIIALFLTAGCLSEGSKTPYEQKLSAIPCPLGMG